jgi:hypothetical protein
LAEGVEVFVHEGVTVVVDVVAGLRSPTIAQGIAVIAVAAERAALASPVSVAIHTTCTQTLDTGATAGHRRIPDAASKYVSHALLYTRGGGTALLPRHTRLAGALLGAALIGITRAVVVDTVTTHVHHAWVDASILIIAVGAERTMLPIAVAILVDTALVHATDAVLAGLPSVTRHGNAQHPAAQHVGYTAHH